MRFIQLSGDLKHYTDSDDFNRVIYHQRSTDVDSRMNIILADAEVLLIMSSSEFNDSTEDELFICCLSEQTIVENNVRRLCSKEAGMIIPALCRIIPIQKQPTVKKKVKYFFKTNL